MIVEKEMFLGVDGKQVVMEMRGMSDGSVLALMGTFF